MKRKVLCTYATLYAPESDEKECRIFFFLILLKKPLIDWSKVLMLPSRQKYRFTGSKDERGGYFTHNSHNRLSVSGCFWWVVGMSLANRLGFSGRFKVAYCSRIIQGDPPNLVLFRDQNGGIFVFVL